MSDYGVLDGAIDPHACVVGTFVRIFIKLEIGKTKGKGERRNHCRVGTYYDIVLKV